MELIPSLLDLRFVLLLSGLGLSRVLWPTKWYAPLVAVASGLLLGFAAPKTLLVISAITLLYLYPVHRLTRIDAGASQSAVGRRWLLAASIGGLVVILVVFKLYRHFALPWLGGALIREEILALVGFSYFLFRAISFLHVQSIIKMDERAPWTILAYALFPPTITSGPIQKYQDFRDQLRNPMPLTSGLVCSAAYRITRGYFRKVVVAFVLNETLTKLLGEQHLTLFTSAAIVGLLYLYFYFDFAGYSDIAIGFGLLLGIRVPENFRKPFFATNVSEFWRNWHITLVDWFRDNLFIPLGGMQSSRLRAASLAFAIMVLCGLWHGLTLSFLVWGVWHGSQLFLEGVLGSRPVPPSLRHGPGYWSRVVWTNARVALGCVCFLPSTAAMSKVMHGLVGL